MAVVEQAVEHSADGGRIAQQFAPVLTLFFRVDQLAAGASAK